MKRPFLYVFLCTFTIIGSVIGAGFITGKEVFVFFAKDFSLAGIYLAFLCFSFAIYLVMSMLCNSRFIYVELFVCFANVIIAGCMISALDIVYKRIFCISEKVKILSIITAILLFILSLKGILYVEKFSSLTLPFMMVIIIVLCLLKIDGYSVSLSPKSYDGIIKPFVYVGFNVVLSAGIIKNSGEKLSPPLKIVTSLITSLLLCVCIFLLSLAVKKEGYNSEMPFISLFYSNKKLLKIIDIITLFAIYSTLISSLYTINNFGGIKIKLKYKTLLFLVVIFISYLGFEVIVERLYLSLGFLAYATILVSYLLSKPFLKERRERTFPLLKSKE